MMGEKGKKKNQPRSAILALRAQNFPLSTFLTQLTSHRLGRHHCGRTPGPASRHAGELLRDGGSLLGAANARATDGRRLFDGA